jgi:hypothetical protein
LTGSAAFNVVVNELSHSGPIVVFLQGDLGSLLTGVSCGRSIVVEVNYFSAKLHVFGYVCPSLVEKEKAFFCRFSGPSFGDQVGSEGVGFREVFLDFFRFVVQVRVLGNFLSEVGVV